jgi:hypothetical protein
MKHAVWVAVFAVAGAGAAAAQEDPDKRVDELKRQFERSLKGLQEKFDSEKGRLEKEFRSAVEKLKGGKAEPKKAEPKKGEGEKGKEGGKMGLEQLVERLVDRVDRLEKKLDGMGGLYRSLPKDFDFKRFGDFKQFEDWGELLPPRFREFMEKRKGDDEFRFEFKAPPGKKKDGEKPEEKKKKKDKGKGEEDSF